MAANARPARRDDFPAVARFDLTYAADRVLAVERSGGGPELTFSLRWQSKPGAPPVVYSTYTVEWLERALGRAGLFLIAEAEARPVGLLIARHYDWTDAAEMTDLAVDAAARRSGAGTALVDAASRWAREQGRRALWVEPRADNAAAIEFYLARGFRLSGFDDRLYSNSDDEPGRTTLCMYVELG